MTTITFDVPDRILVRTVEGKPVYWEPAKTAAVAADIYRVGGLTILTNAFNGGGSKASDAEKLAAMQKKLDAWERGEFRVVERGETAFTGMREAFIDELRGNNEGMSLKAAEAFIADKVHAALGKDAKATFSNYLDVVAADLVKAGDFDNAADAREALEAHYGKLADDAAKKRAKAAKKVVVPKLDLSAFKKSK